MIVFKGLYIFLYYIYIVVSLTVVLMYTVNQKKRTEFTFLTFFKIFIYHNLLNYVSFPAINIIFYYYYYYYY